MGFTEVLPLERVLEAPQAHQPGKLRALNFRGLDFEVPEFPRLGAAQDGVATLPPPDLGEHTLGLLRAAGMTAKECDDLLESGAVVGATPSDFAWAPMKRDA
jgi:crotonobetainyl-CoA:carnitine CoA-transferase CaiB-like acyl-CoA transferase